MCCMDAPEAQTLVKPRPTPAEPLSFANGGTIKRHHHHVPHVRPPSPLYRECLKNHAAAHGGHVLDGCGEFMPSPLASPADPTSLKCAACGCHRNFHRRDDDINAISLVVHNLSAGSDDAVNGDATPKRRSSSSASPRLPSAATNPAPPPISSSYFPSAPQVLLALSTGLTGTPNGSVSPGAARKRFRTKFSREQKEKMFAFAEKIGWKMQKQDERIVEDFCEEVGVGKGVLKVWMHNNKHTLAKKDPLATTPVLTIEINNNSNQDNNNNNNNNNNSSSNEIEQNNNGIHLFNGSSSSS